MAIETAAGNARPAGRAFTLGKAVSLVEGLKDLLGDRLKKEIAVEAPRLGSRDRMILKVLALGDDELVTAEGILDQLYFKPKG